MAKQFVCEEGGNIDEVTAQIMETNGEQMKWALYGDLGAGKTTLIKSFCRLLGLDSWVDSPTFTLMNVYQGPPVIVHFDLYRIRNAEELYDIGYEEYFYGPDHVFVEWADMAESLIPDFFSRIYIDVDPHSRIRTFKVV